MLFCLFCFFLFIRSVLEREACRFKSFCENPLFATGNVNTFSDDTSPEAAHDRPEVTGLLRGQRGVETHCAKRPGFPIWRKLPCLQNPPQWSSLRSLLISKITIQRIHPDLCFRKPCVFSAATRLHWGGNATDLPFQREARGSQGYFLHVS